MIDLKRLRELLSKATPGRWQTEGGMDLYVFTEGNETMIAEMRGTGAGLSDNQQADNARYIAALDPPTVKAILDALDAATGALETVRDECSCDTPEYCYDAANEALAQVQKLLGADSSGGEK